MRREYYSSTQQFGKVCSYHQRQVRRPTICPLCLIRASRKGTNITLLMKGFLSTLRLFCALILLNISWMCYANSSHEANQQSRPEESKNSQLSTLNSQPTLPPYHKSSTKWLYKAPTPQKLPAPLPLYKSSQAKHWKASTPSKWLMLSSISVV